MDLRAILSLQSAKTASLPKVELFKGQIFLGKIMKLFPDSRALVQLGGLQVHARLEAPLEAGKSYWLKVANSQGTPELKVIPSRAMPQQKTSPLAAPLLEELGLTPTKQREDVIRAFMKENLPFSKNMVLKGAEWLKSTADKQTAMDVIRQMAVRQLPFTRTVFEALLNEREGTPIHERLNGLSKVLEASNENFPALQKLRTLLPELTLKSGASGEEIKQSLQQIITRLGLSYENGLLKTNKQTLPQPEVLKQLLTEIIQQTPSEELRQQAQTLLLQLNGQPPTTTAALQKLIQPLLAQTLSHAQGTPDPSLVQQQETLKPLLLQVLQQTASSDVKQQAQALLANLTSQQLNASGVFQTVIQLPVQIGNHRSDVTIKWEGQKKKNGSFDADFCRILFYLELEHLRETAVDVNIQKRFVSIWVYNEMFDLHPLIDQFEPSLKETLESAGYHLSSLRQAEGKGPESIHQSKADPVSGVDFRI